MAEGESRQSKKNVEDVNNALQQQLAIMNQLRESLASMTQDLEKYCSLSSKCLGNSAEWKNLSKEVEENSRQTKTTASSTQQLSQKMGELGKKMAGLAPIIGGVTGAVKGLKQGFTNLFAVGKGIFNFFGSIVKGALKVGQAILSIPFKMMKGLESDALAGQGAADELFESMENLRKEFGAIGPTSEAVKSVSASMQGFSDTGLSAYGVFGNVAQRMKYMTELATQMGPQFAANAEEFKRNGGAILAYQKGLGLTGEQMAAVAIRGKMMGKDMSDVLKDTTKQAMHMAKAFGLDAKVISKDMGKAMSDVAHFGHLSSQQIGAAVVYANKLGVSIDKLTGLMDQFDTFDKAADSTSKLNEQFGTNIDSMELMAAQSPAEKMEILRKSFLATGKDMSQLSFQQRKLIQQTTGLDQATFDAAMSSSEQGDLLADINKESKKAEDKTMSQADALKQVAVQIERLNNSVKAGEGGFLGNLAAGFSRGVKSSAEYQRVMGNLRQSMQIAGQTGVQLGQVFVKAFPGVKQMLGALGDLFSPARFMKLSNGVMKVVGKFFDPKTGEFKGKFEDLLEELKKVFFDFFESGKPASNKFFEGFKKFGEMAGKIFSGLVNFIVPKLAEAINKIADWISKPKIPKVGAKKEWFQPFLDAFETIKNQLGPALKKLGLAIWEKLKEGLLGTKVGKGIIAGAIAMVVGPALLQGLAGAGAGGALKSGINALFGKKQGAATDAAGAAQQGAAAAGAVGAGMVSSPSEMMNRSIPDPETLKKMQEASKTQLDWGSLTKFLLGIAGVFYIGLKAFGEALKIVKDVPAAEIAKAAIVFGAVALMLVPAGKFISYLDGLGKIDGKSLAMSVAALGVVMLEGLGIFLLGVMGIKKLNVGVGDILKTALLFLAMLPAFVSAGIVVAEAAIVGAIVNNAKKEVLVGMATMGLVLLAMIGTAGIMGGMAKLIGANEMKAGAEALLAISKVFMIAGVVIGEAALIGAGIIASAGLGAAAISVGLGVMGIAVGAMALTAILIAQKLSEIKENPEALKKKSEAFESIMNGIASLMDKIKGIIDAMDFGFFESGDSINARIKLMTDFVKTLISGADGKGGIQGVVQTIIDGMKEMKPERVEGAKAFAGILQAVGNLMGSVGQVIQSVNADEATHWWSSAEENGKAMKDAMDGATDLLGAMIPKITDLVNTLIQSMNKLPTDPGKLKAAEVFGTMLGAVGNLMKAITPNIKDFMNTAKAEGSYLWGLVKAGGETQQVNTQAIDAVSIYMTKMLDSMKDNLPELMSALTRGIVNSLKDVPKQTLDALPNVAKIIEAAVGLINALSASNKEVKIDKVETGMLGKAEILIKSEGPDLAGMLNQFKTHMPGFITSMIDLAKILPKDVKFKEKIDTLVSVFAALKQMIDGIKSVGDIPKLDGQSTTEALQDALLNVRNVLALLTYETPYKGVRIDLGNFIWYFNELETIMGGLKSKDGPKKIAEIFDTIQKVMTAIKDPFKDYGEGEGVQEKIAMVLWNQIMVLKYLTYGKEGWANSIAISNFVEKLNAISDQAQGFQGNIGGVKKVITTTVNLLNELKTLADAVPPEVAEKEGFADKFLLPYKFAAEVFTKLIDPSDSGFRGQNVFESIMGVSKNLKKIGYDSKELVKLEKLVSDTDAFLGRYLKAVQKMFDNNWGVLKNINKDFPKFNKDYTTLGLAADDLSIAMKNLIESGKRLQNAIKGSDSLNVDVFKADIGKITEFWAAADVPLQDIGRAFTEVDKVLSATLQQSMQGGIDKKLQALTTILDLPAKIKEFGKEAPEVKTALKAVASSILTDKVSRTLRASSDAELTINVNVTLDPVALLNAAAQPAVQARSKTALKNIFDMSDTRDAANTNNATR